MLFFFLNEKRKFSSKEKQQSQSVYTICKGGALKAKKVVEKKVVETVHTKHVAIVVKRINIW